MRTAILAATILLAGLAVAAGQEPISLIDPAKPAGGWNFGNGPEFPGAQGKLEVAAEKYRDQRVLHLEGDFTKGGNYVEGSIHLPSKPLDTLTFWVNPPLEADRLTLRLVDGSEQCHQLRLKLVPRVGWQQIVLPVDELFRNMGTPAALDIVANYENWGGAKDGRWHQPGKLLAVLYGRGMSSTPAAMLLSDVRFRPGTAPSAGVPKTVSLAEMLESGELDWQYNGGEEFAGAKGGLEAVADQPHAGQHAMRLHADFTGGGAYVGARRSFGSWNIRAMNQVHVKMRSEATKCFSLRMVDGTGQCHQRKQLPVTADGAWHDVELVPEKIAGGEHWGGANDGKWHDPVRLIELMLNPEAHDGKKPELLLADLRADVILDSADRPIEPRIDRVLLATKALGNLFLPGEPVAVQVTVEAIRPLPENQRVLRYTLRDYWGAEQLPPGEVPLANSVGKDRRWFYTAEIMLPADQLMVGKYYELHAEIPQEIGRPVWEYTGLAILPPAVAKSFEPEKIPFTIRNWDSRISVYFELADRLGLRQMGVWGGWSSKSPYKPHCPGIELCGKLGAKWVTGTPASDVEQHGFAEYSEESLRQGMKEFLEKYAGSGLSMIAMGNEPHGTGQKVLDNVRAYRAVYEAVKAFNPAIHVIGTSVEPNEEYFKAGYQNYLDSYDFHIYEHYTDVRRTMQEYRALMKKYGCVKPIHSTELGLNSQGQTRHAVAVEMIKKFTVFFAEGGDTVSWFTIQYPDAQGKARGQFGDSHCVFDCKYNLYNPRLDAITYYLMINSICDKKFVAEKHYPNGVQAYLFRDAAGKCLQIVWLDERREDIRIPLPAGKVGLIHLDGDRTTLTSDGGVTLTASAEPVLLLYRDSGAGLAESLAAPLAAATTIPAAARSGETATISLTGPGLTAGSLRVSGPPGWKTELKQAEQGRCEILASVPPATHAREGRIAIQLVSPAGILGELTVPLRITRPD